MSGQASVLELPSVDRTWWVQVVDPARSTWVWTDRPERATVFPSRSTMVASSDAAALRPFAAASSASSHVTFFHSPPWRTIGASRRSAL